MSVSPCFCTHSLIRVVIHIASCRDEWQRHARSFAMVAGSWRSRRIAPHDTDFCYDAAGFVTPTYADKATFWFRGLVSGFDVLFTGITTSSAAPSPASLFLSLASSTTSFAALSPASLFL